MAAIAKVKDPIGVLYRTNNTAGPCNKMDNCLYGKNACYCVHNGILYRAWYKSGNKPEKAYKRVDPSLGRLVGVDIRHWTLKAAAQGIKLPCLETKHLVNIINVRKTPAKPLKPPVCNVSRKGLKGSIVKAGTPAGIWFDEGKADDIKNGVFLYWTDKTPKQRYCQFVNDKDNPARFTYYHYIIVKDTSTVAGVRLSLQRRSRSHIINVFKNTSAAKNPKLACT